MEITKETSIFESQILSHCVITPRLHKIILQKPINYQYSAGQYLGIYFDEIVFRFYSIANAPSTNFLEIHIQKTKNPITEKFISEVRIGKKVHIISAQGVCTSPKEINRPVLLIAGGCGFAPIKAIIEDFILKKEVKFPIYLYWGGRDIYDIYYLDELNKLRLKYSWFNFEIILERKKSNQICKARIGYSTDFLFNGFPDIMQYNLFVAGLKSMISVLFRKALKHNLKIDNFHTDYQIEDLKRTL